MSTFIAVTN